MMDLKGHALVQSNSLLAHPVSLRPAGRQGYAPKLAIFHYFNYLVFGR